MKTKRLGASDLEVPVIGLGCMVLPGFYGPGSEENAIATPHEAVDIGENFSIVRICMAPERIEN